MCGIQLPTDLQVDLPHLDTLTTEVAGLKYTIHAWTFHQGSGLRGHYRTSIRAHQQWWHYDDGAVPTNTSNLDPSKPAATDDGLGMQRLNFD